VSTTPQGYGFTGRRLKGRWPRAERSDGQTTVVSERECPVADHPRRIRGRSSGPSTIASANTTAPLEGDTSTRDNEPAVTLWVCDAPYEGGHMTDRPAQSTVEATPSSAVRWLHRSYRLGAIVDGFATVGMLFPDRLWTVGFNPPFDRNRPESAYGMRAAAPLMAGWTVLLLWADRKPLERKDVLAITAIPVVAG
jgi:hypothetical protein